MEPVAWKRFIEGQGSTLHWHKDDSAPDYAWSALVYAEAAEREMEALVKALRSIVALANYDEQGVTGPANPIYSYETVAMMMHDYARAALASAGKGE